MTDGVGAAPAAAPAADSSSAMSGGFDSAMSGGFDAGSVSSFDSALDSAGSLSTLGSIDTSSLTGGTSLSSDMFSSAPLSTTAPSSFGSTSFGSTSPDDGSLLGTTSLSAPLGLSSPSLFDPAPLSSNTPIGFSSTLDFSSAMPGAFTGLSSSFGPAPAPEPIAAPEPIPVSLPPSQEFSPGDINPVTNNVVTEVTPRGEIVHEAPAAAAPVEPIAQPAVDTTTPALFDPTPIAQQPVTLETPTPSAALFDPAALGGVVTPVADQGPAAPPQIGYGDQPLGVPVSGISRLTEADAAAFVDERLAEYRNATDRAAKDAALDRALNAAYAWRAQGGDVAPFQQIMDAVAGDPRDAITAQVVRDRANAIVASGIAGNIRALNNNGVNFGAQIHELQYAIDQDPDNAYGIISRAYSALRGGTDSGVNMIETSAFRQAMSGLGYGPELQDATTNYAARLESDRIAERAALAQMSTQERISYMVGRAMDAGLPVDIGASIAMAGAFAPMRAGASQPRTAVGTEAINLVPRSGPRGVDPNHHNANVLVRDAAGNVVAHQRIVSGNMTLEEQALGFPRNTLASHTEARAVRTMPLEPGGSMTITGQNPPCPSCKGVMNQAATESGATIRYQWRENGRTLTWTATPR
jgi:hypothetical protein